MNSIEDVDGNTESMNDQGEVLDASHSQEESVVTEQEAAPRTEETKTEVAKVDAKPAHDWEKSHKELDRVYTKSQQELSALRKEYEALAPYKDKIPSWAKADELLSRDPASMQYLQARHQGFSHQEAQSIAEQSQHNPALSKIMDKVNSFETFVQGQQKEHQAKQVSSFLDQQEAAASKVYKDFFGKDMGQAEKSALYNYMTERNIYDGEAVVHALYAKQYAEHYGQKLLADQKSKGTKVVQQTRTQNSNAKAPEKTMSLREAIRSSFEEAQGQE